MSDIWAQIEKVAYEAWKKTDDIITLVKDAVTMTQGEDRIILGVEEDKPSSIFPEGTRTFLIESEHVVEGHKGMCRHVDRAYAYRETILVLSLSDMMTMSLYDALRKLTEGEIGAE